MIHDYEDVIDFKLKSAAYHHQNCIDAIDNWNQFDSDEGQTIAISSEVTAMLLVYQSIFDILAQLIKYKRNLNINKRKLYFSTIIRHLHKIEDLKNDILTLEKESIYIRDYCNTVKHRNLIYIKKIEVQQTAMIGIGMNMGAQVYYNIDSFKRDNNQYRSRSLPQYVDDIQNTLPKIINKIKSQV